MEESKPQSCVQDTKQTEGAHSVPLERLPQRLKWLSTLKPEGVLRRGLGIGVGYIRHIIQIRQLGMLDRHARASTHRARRNEMLEVIPSSTYNIKVHALLKQAYSRR